MLNRTVIHRRGLLGAALLSGLLLTPLAQASEIDPRVAAEVEAALVRLYEVGALDGTDPETPLLLESQPRTRYELGAVVDVASSESGLPVMAVTPGSVAERIGLQTGDRLLRLNQVALTGALDPAGSFVAAVEASAGSFDLAVARDGREIQLSGMAEPTEVPGYRLQVIAPRSGCGRIDTTLKPPITQDIHPLVLHEIDGRLGGPLQSETFRLKPGRHVLKLSEAIEPRHFTFNQNRKRSNLFRHERFKDFEIDIQADGLYRIGAKLIRDAREEIRSGAYWEPVVWSVSTLSCR